MPEIPDQKRSLEQSIVDALVRVQDQRPKQHALPVRNPQTHLPEAEINQTNAAMQILSDLFSAIQFNPQIIHQFHSHHVIYPHPDEVVQTVGLEWGYKLGLTDREETSGILEIVRHKLTSLEARQTPTAILLYSKNGVYADVSPYHMNIRTLPCIGMPNPSFSIYHFDTSEFLENPACIVDPLAYLIQYTPAVTCLFIKEYSKQYRCYYYKALRTIDGNPVPYHQAETIL